MKRAILALGVLVAIVAPVMAGEYYFVHGQDRHCNVVERIHEGRDFIQVGALEFWQCGSNGYYRDQERREERCVGPG
jgi:hypothetical protein